ncbi:MAG: hypothetical protein AB1546_06240 [bacterium]
MKIKKIILIFIAFYAVLFSAQLLLAVDPSNVSQQDVDSLLFLKNQVDSYKNAAGSLKEMLTSGIAILILILAASLILMLYIMKSIAKKRRGHTHHHLEHHHETHHGSDYDHDYDHKVHHSHDHPHEHHRHHDDSHHSEQ